MTAVDEVRQMLEAWAEGFAEACRSTVPHGHDLDPRRSGELLAGSRGIQEDEASAFFRGVQEGLVEVDADGRFLLPGAGECSPNLHLVGRSGEQVALHTEYLIHIGAYAELVLDWGWDPASIAFETGEFDILGLQEERVVLAVEAKARETGPDSLTSLRQSLLGLVETPGLAVPANHGRKWEELLRLTRSGPVDLCLVADGARWMWEVLPLGEGVEIRSPYRPVPYVR